MKTVVSAKKLVAVAGRIHAAEMHIATAKKLTRGQVSTLLARIAHELLVLTDATFAELVLAVPPPTAGPDAAARKTVAA